jgi:hypothetical protein
MAGAENAIAETAAAAKRVLRSIGNVPLQIPNLTTEMVDAVQRKRRANPRQLRHSVVNEGVSLAGM